MTRVGAEVTAGRKPKLQVTKFQCNGKTSVSTVPDINPEYTRGLVNIEPDILATTGYAGIITTGEKGLSEFESESI